MSFGFSAGDFIAVGKLVTDIIFSLQAGGSRSDYQELVRELDSLQRALEVIENLQCTPGKPKAFETLKSAALSCRHPLEKFKAKIEKYKHYLGIEPARLDGVTKKRRLKWLDMAKDMGHKIKWELKMKKEAQNLRTYLMLHQGNLNMQLGVLGINFNQEVLAVVARRHIATPQPEYVLPNLQLKRSRFVNRTPKNSTGRRRVKSLRTFRELIRRRALSNISERVRKLGVHTNSTQGATSITNSELIEILSMLTNRHPTDTDTITVARAAKSDSRAILTFTILTIIFVPTSFVTSLLGIGIKG